MTQEEKVKYLGQFIFDTLYKKDNDIFIGWMNDYEADSTTTVDGELDIEALAKEIIDELVKIG